MSVVGTGSVPGEAQNRICVTLQLKVFHTIFGDVALAQYHTESDIPIRVDSHL